MFDPTIHDRHISVRKALEIIESMVAQSPLYHYLNYYSGEEYIDGCDRYWGDFTFEPSYTAVGYYLECDRDSIELRPDPLGKLAKRKFKLDRATVRWSATAPDTKQALLSAQMHVEAAKLAAHIEAVLQHKFITETIRIHREPPKPHLIDKMRHRIANGTGDPAALLMHKTNEQLREIIEDINQTLNVNLNVSGNKSDLEDRIIGAAEVRGDHLIVEQHNDWRKNMYEEIPFKEWREAKREVGDA